MAPKPKKPTNSQGRTLVQKLLGRPFNQTGRRKKVPATGGVVGKKRGVYSTAGAKTTKSAHPTTYDYTKAISGENPGANDAQFLESLKKFKANNRGSKVILPSGAKGN